MRVRIPCASAVVGNLGRITLVCLALTLTGCINQQTAQAVAETGGTASQTLARFYRALMQQEEDQFALIKVRDALKVKCENCAQEDITTSEGIIKALQARVEMADSLSAGFAGLKDLSSSGARAEIAGAAGTFGKALDAVAQTSILGTALPIVAGEFSRWQQSQRLADTLQLLDKAMDSVANKVFATEAGEYERLADRREGAMKGLIEVLVNNNMVSTAPLVQNLLSTYGLPVTASTLPPDALKQLVELRAKKLTLLSKGAVHGMGRALSLLAAASHTAATGGSPHLSAAKTALLETQKYLDAMDQFRREFTVPQQGGGR